MTAQKRIVRAWLFAMLLAWALVLVAPNGVEAEGVPFPDGGGGHVECWWTDDWDISCWWEAD